MSTRGGGGGIWHFIKFIALVFFAYMVAHTDRHVSEKYDLPPTTEGRR